MGVVIRARAGVQVHSGASLPSTVLDAPGLEDSLHNWHLPGRSWGQCGRPQEATTTPVAWLHPGQPLHPMKRGPVVL